MVEFPSATLLHLAAGELVQLAEEGREIGPLQALYDEACSAAEAAAERAMQEFWRLAPAAPMRADFPYTEPTAWDELLAACPELDALPAPLPGGPSLHDRIHGAWLGRCAGCMLGKPVEGRSRDEIAALLNIAGEYPLNDYFPAIADAGEIPYALPSAPTLRSNIRYSARDDDTDYTVLSLHLLKTHGLDLATAHVAAEWLARLPYHKTYTAERVAYRNLILEVPPERVAIVLNPYREWIGAQIRADAFGYACPGWAYQAARLAYQDAAISHVNNGIYGEIFFAAMLAESLVSDFGRIDTVIERALRAVPPESRFAEMVRTVRACCSENSTWEETFEQIGETYGRYHPVHTINNAALVLMRLLHSEGDFGRAICIAVMGGWDTDCNGATAGSVMGALLGAERLPDKWVAPLNDTLHSALDGYNVNSISDLATQTAELALSLRRQAP